MTEKTNSKTKSIIENEVFQKIINGREEGQKKKPLLQETAQNVFLSHFPSGGYVTTQGPKIAKQIIYGGVKAARQLDWSAEKAVKQLSRGLLEALQQIQNNFIENACVVVRAVIQCSRTSPLKPEKTCELVIGVILTVGEKQHCDIEDLKIRASRTAIQSLKSCSDTATRDMLYALVNGKCQIDESGCHWN